MQGTALVLLPGFVYQFWLNERPRVEREDILVLVASSAFLAIHFGSWVWSLDNTSLVHSLLFVNTHPLVLVALMPLMGRAVSRGHVMGVCIGCVGAAVTLLQIGGERPVTPEGDAA